MLVYDVTDRQLFEWFRDVMVPKYLSQNPEHFALYIVANNDAALKREVSFEEGLLLAQMTNTTYYEISTKRGTNCEDLF